MWDWVGGGRQEVYPQLGGRPGSPGENSGLLVLPGRSAPSHAEAN